MQKQKEQLGGDAKVAILWDSALTDIVYYGIDNGNIIFDAESWRDSDLNDSFNYVGFNKDLEILKINE